MADRPVTDSAWDLIVGSLGNGVRVRYGLPRVLTHPRQALGFIARRRYLGDCGVCR